jgi:hypothetical protein
MEGEVTALALRVRAPPERSEALRRVAEEFTVRVLRRCDELLEARAPGRVVCVRELELAFRLFDRALSQEGEIDAFADEIAEKIHSWAQSAGETPSGDPELAVFVDELAWRAAHLEACAAGLSESAWRFESLEAEGEPNRTLLDGQRTPWLHELLSRLRKRGSLRSTLAALPVSVLDAVAETLGVRAVPIEQSVYGALPGAREVIDACLVELPSSTPLRLASVCVAVMVRDVLGPTAPDLDVAGAAHAALIAFIERRGEVVASDALLSESGDTHGSVPEHAEAGLASAFGGLFFLLNPALELSIGECLWRACLPEGRVLARTATALLGSVGAGDPAAALFGGAQDHGPFAEVSPDQQAEISRTLLTALRDALPRRGLAELPQVRLRLVDTPGGRLLTAAASSSPFVFFAAPARLPDEAQAALDAFLAVWPASAPAPSAARGLAELDRRARVQPVRGPLPPVALLLAEEGSVPACALVTQIAGVLGHLFAARVGLTELSSSMDLVTRQLSHPARVLLEEETLEIRMPMEHLDLDVRRAGLDTNPGWVPWLRRTVTFTYEDQAVLAGNARPEE